MAKWIVGGLLVLALSIGAMVVMAFAEFSDIYQADMEAEREYQDQMLIEGCMNDAYDNYTDQWVSFCKVNNILITPDGNCNIDVINADRLNSEYDREKTMCIERFK